MLSLGWGRTYPSCSRRESVNLLLLCVISSGEGRIQLVRYIIKMIEFIIVEQRIYSQRIGWKQILLLLGICLPTIAIGNI